MSLWMNDGMVGDMDPDPSYGGLPDDRSWSSPVRYKYQFMSEEELITSDVFQKCLTQALAFKDKVIDDLRQEIMGV